MHNAERIKNYIIRQIGRHPSDIVAVAAKHFGVTRTAVRRHLNSLLKQGRIEVFKKFQDPNTLSFARTEIIVELSRLNEEVLISRSQAKRILLDLEKFSYITLDFSGIRLVGQGFVDEVFRVFTNAHPNIVIEYINANNDVTFMIKRSLATTKRK